MQRLDLHRLPPAAARALDLRRPVADGSTEVDLTWRSVANATRYEVEYKTTASDVWLDHPGSTTTASRSVAGLMCGTTHDFRVRAHGDGTNRASHWGPWSETASEDTEACTNSPPTFALSSYTFNVSEDAADDASVGTATATDPDMDAITYSLGGTTFFEIDSNGQITVDGSLSGRGGTTYEFTVTASDGVNSPPTSISARVIVDLGDFPTLDAPTPDLLDDGATVEVDFTLPHRNFHYRLTLYREISSSQLAVISSGNPVFGDSSHEFVIPGAAETGEDYLVGIKACRDEAPNDARCDTEVYSSNMPASDVVSVSIIDLAATSLEGGTSKTFGVDIDDLASSQTYLLKVHTESGGVLKFDGCGDDGEDPKTFDPVTGSVGLERSGIVVFACVSKNSSDEIYATISVGTVEIARSGEETVETTPLPLPTGARANGDADNNGDAQIIVRWDDTGSRYSYEVAYGAECVEGTTDEDTTTKLCNETTSTWMTPVATTATYAELAQGIVMDRLYRLQVRTTFNGVTSRWVEPLFAYTSDNVPSVRVANTPFYGHQPNNDYFYRICTNRFPEGADVGAFAADIESGISAWENKIRWSIGAGSSQRNILTTTRDPNSDSCLPYVAPILNYSYAEVRFADRLVLIARCFGVNAETRGCAPLSRLTLTAETRFTNGTFDIPIDVDILLESSYNWTRSLYNNSNCTILRSFSIHESGHPLGVRLDHAKLERSVMRAAVSESYCDPQPYDVLGFMALYQSNDPR